MNMYLWPCCFYLQFDGFHVIFTCAHSVIIINLSVLMENVIVPWIYYFVFDCDFSFHPELPVSMLLITCMIPVVVRGLCCLAYKFISTLA